MNNKYLFTAIAAVVVIIIALVLVTQNRKNDNDLANQTNTATNANTEADENSNANTTNANVNTNTMAPTPEQTTPDGNDVAVYEIAFNGTAFNPAQLEIKNGDVVIFKNESDKSFWPASGPHPTHTLYPEFDAKKAIAPGSSWQFKFTKVGIWPFHDHLTPSAFGKIIVK